MLGTGTGCRRGLIHKFKTRHCCIILSKEMATLFFSFVDPIASNPILSRSLA